MARLQRNFFDRETVDVARDLLGKCLVRIENNCSLAGIISEAEAYRGESDQACHARIGRTKRTAVMYGLPGTVYVYFTYGMHWMLNFVTEKKGFPAAVLIRALLPVKGLEIIARRRKSQPAKRWTDGPGKICQAFGIDGSLNGNDVCAPDAQIFLRNHYDIPDAGVLVGPRVGLTNVPEPWRSIPWRFRIAPAFLEKMVEISQIAGANPGQI